MGSTYYDMIAPPGRATVYRSADMENPDKTNIEAQAETSTARKLFWASAGFYGLIAFEFFYMASPFGVHFYSVYGPGLDWLQQSGFSGWTIRFFLPHLVEETRSHFVNAAESVGFILFCGGVLAFAVGAFQVYRAKLTKADAVTGGLYRHIRHPQYLALMIASTGMLLIWPRFLVLFSTCLLFLAYILLAKAEEKICLRQYEGYAGYMATTGRFLPKRLSWRLLPTLPSRTANVGLRIAAFIAVVLGLTAGALSVRNHAIASLYTLMTDRGVYLSVAEISNDDLELLARVAGQSKAVRAQLEGLGADDRFLAYVLPTEMYVSEIPMHLPGGESFGHSIPSDRDPARYKVIFSRAVFPAGRLPDGSNVIAHATNKHPLVEVHIDLSMERVDAVFPPPAVSFYPDVQVPLF